MKLAVILAAAATVNIGPGANGTTIRVHTGDRLVVTLPANASTGYSWSVVSKRTPVVRLVSARYVAPKTALLGAPGRFVARFTVRTAGRTTLRLAYARHTHPATPPARRFAVTLVAS